MRFDTVLNDLVGAAVHDRQGRRLQRRQAVAAGRARRGRRAGFLRRARGAASRTIHNQAFNNGAEHLNHQVIELAEIAARTVPGCELEVLGQADADQRTYKTDFSKFARTFPDFEFEWTPDDGRRTSSSTRFQRDRA